MGTDISGFVECRTWRPHEDGEDTPWRAAIDLFFLARAVGLPTQPGDEPQTWPEGGEWLIDDVLYRSETMTRRGAFPENGEWEPVWTVMEAPAALHGANNVRLVVWFEN